MKTNDTLKLHSIISHRELDGCEFVEFEYDLKVNDVVLLTYQVKSKNKLQLGSFDGIPDRNLQFVQLNIFSKLIIVFVFHI